MSDVVWSVNILLGIGLIGVTWWIYDILYTASKEDAHLQNQENQEDS